MRKLSVTLLVGVAIGSVPAMAQQTTAPIAADSDETEIVVFGKGETRQVQEVGNKELLILAPGTSPLNFPASIFSPLIPSAPMNGQAAYRSAGSTRTSLGILWTAFHWVTRRTATTTVYISAVRSFRTISV